MKYIFGLSLSGICLAMFVFVIQGNKISGDVNFGSFLNEQKETTVVAANVETVELKTLASKSSTKQRMTAVERKPVQRFKTDVKRDNNRDWEHKSRANYGITQEEAVTIALNNMPGELIGVKWKKGNYRVKVWSNSEGATYKIYIDPQSGKVVRKKRK